MAPSAGETTHNKLVDIIAVDSVDRYLEQAERAGAQIVRNKREIPGVGYAGYIRDPERTPLASSRPLTEDPA